MSRCKAADGASCAQGSSAEVPVLVLVLGYRPSRQRLTSRGGRGAMRAKLNRADQTCSVLRFELEVRHAAD